MTYTDCSAIPRDRRQGSGTLRRTQTGFSLYELLIVLVLMTLLGTFAIPALTDAMSNTRITEATNNMVTSMNFARSEAMKRGFDVALCAAPGAQEKLDPEITDCNATGETFDAGYMVVASSAPAADTDPLDFTPIRVLGESQPSVVASGEMLADYLITFDGKGRLKSRTRTRISVCDDRGPKFGRIITVNTSGMIEVGNYPNGSTDCALP